MTKEDFFKDVEVREGIELPYWKVKPPRNYLEETGRRIKAVGGAVPNVVVYGSFLFMESQVSAGKDIGKPALDFSDACNVRRDFTNKIALYQKTGKVIL